MSPPNRLGGIESDKHGMMKFWSNGVMEYWGIGITFNNWLHVLDLHRKESLTNPKGKLGCRPDSLQFPTGNFLISSGSIWLPVSGNSVRRYSTPSLHYPVSGCSITIRIPPSLRLRGAALQSVLGQRGP
jgi:hypothetical protein